MSELDFDDVIDKYVQNKNKSKKKELAIGKYAASAIGSCLRKLYYSYTAPIELLPSKLKIFEVGNIFHDYIAKLLGESEDVALVSNERDLGLVDLDSDLMISGRLDDVIMIQKNEEKIIVEVKSIKSLDYLDVPHSSHIMQLTIYLKAMQHYGVNKGIILYINKNDLKTKSFEIPYDDKILKEAFERARKLHKYLVAGTLPPAEAKLNKEMSWACSYCEYSGMCGMARK